MQQKEASPQLLGLRPPGCCPATNAFAFSYIAASPLGAAPTVSSVAISPGAPGNFGDRLRLSRHV